MTWPIILILSACATEPLVLPSWEATERDSKPITPLTTLPTLCELPTDGIWSLDCWSKFVAYEEIAYSNTDIGKLNTEALQLSDEAYDQIVAAGKLQSQLALIREEMLARERQAHTFDNWFYRAVILVGLVAVGAAL